MGGRDPGLLAPVNIQAIGLGGLQEVPEPACTLRLQGRGGPSLLSITKSLEPLYTKQPSLASSTSETVFGGGSRQALLTVFPSQIQTFSALPGTTPPHPTPFLLRLPLRVRAAGFQMLPPPTRPLPAQTEPAPHPCLAPSPSPSPPAPSKPGAQSRELWN